MPKKNKKSKKITPKNHPNCQNIGRVPMYGIVKSIVFFTLSSHSHTFPFRKIGKGKSCPGREKIEIKKSSKITRRDN